MERFVVSVSAPAVNLFSELVHAASWVWAAHEVFGTHSPGYTSRRYPATGAGLLSDKCTGAAYPGAEVPNGWVTIHMVILKMATGLPC